MTKKLNEILVVSDVDGTLLQAGYGIPKENIDTIERFVELGGKFTLATGRGVASVGKYIDWVRLSAPAILVNGGIIYDYTLRKVLHEYILDSEVRTVLREILDVFPQLGAEVLIREKIVVIRMNDEIHDHTAVEHIPMVMTELDTVEDKWNKVLFADKPETIPLVMDYVEKRRKHDERFKKYDFVQTSKNYYELIPKGINKAQGLEKLAKIVGVSMENTVAIGDYYNDVELLNAAGVSAVVEDAPDDIKTNADFVVRSCLNGGVADLLTRLINECD